MLSVVSGRVDLCRLPDPETIQRDKPQYSHEIGFWQPVGPLETTQFGDKELQFVAVIAVISCQRGHDAKPIGTGQKTR